MSGTGRYLLHGVARTAPTGLSDALGQQAAGCIEEGGLHALLTVSDEAGALEGRLADPQAAEELAVQHDRLLREATARCDVVPVRLGTVLSGEDAVRDVLRRDAAAFGRALQRIAGTEEYTVELRRLPGTPRPAGRPEAVTPASGRSYLAARSRRTGAKRGQRAVSEAMAARLEDRLAAAMPAVQRGEVRGDAGARDQSRLCHWDVLSPKGRVDALETVLREADAAARDAGLSVRATGPWPAYSFAGDAP